MITEEDVFPNEHCTLGVIVTLKEGGSGRDVKYYSRVSTFCDDQQAYNSASA